MADFGQIVGQARVVERLQRMLAAGRVPHALLFVGPAGAGKATTARALARALNCETSAASACGACASCRKIDEGLHPDVSVLRPSGAGSVLAIDAVRDLAGKLGFAPHEGRARVIILEDADRLTDEAGNAFLKTLEEPPARTHFVLCTAAPERLLMTIQSRCQRVGFVPLSAHAGSAARATELAADQVLEKRRARLRGLVEAARAESFRRLVDAAAELAQSKEEIAPTLDLLATWYRDAAALAAGVSPEILIHSDDLEELKAEVAAVVSRRPAAVLARRAAAVLEAQTALLGYTHPQLTIENMLLKLRGATT